MAMTMAGSEASGRLRASGAAPPRQRVRAARSAAKPGYETAAASIPTTSTPSRLASPATAPSIASRWSPWACSVPPRRPPVPRTTKPSSVASRSPPSAREPVDDGRDPVGLLDAQLGRALDDGLPLGEAAQQGHERQLVDRERDLVGGHARAVQRAVGDLELGERLGVGRRGRARLELAADRRAHPLEDAEEADPGPVGRHALDPQRGAGHEHRGGGVEGGGGGVAGHVQRVEAQVVQARDRDPVALAPHARAGRGEQPLRVVAAGLGLDHGGLPLGQQAGEQHAAT